MMERWPGWAIAGMATCLWAGLAPLVRANGIVPAADGTGTQVTTDGLDHTITGGTPSADNQNLFHRFVEFHLLTGESATFLADPTVLNILSGVTGNNPSVIDGLLQVTGANANLWLINPNGILFGPNAALNLQGSFTATTADQVNFAEGAFGLVGASDYAALVGEPQSFSFSLANPGSVVNRGNLAVSPGESVVLVGGQVLNTGTLTAPGGEIVISAVEGGNLVRIAQDGALLNLEVATLAASEGEPVPFSPLSLPELLTGNAIAPAAAVTVNPDGTVQLTDGPPVPVAPGALTVVGILDVSDMQGGQILVVGETASLPAGLLDISGTTGGNLAIYATEELNLGIQVDATGGGQGLYDPPTLVIDAAAALTIETNLAGGNATVEAEETITVAAAIDTSGQLNANTLFFNDQNADNALTLNLNAPILLGANQTLDGNATLATVNAPGSIQNAVDAVVAGATVNVGPGVYQEGAEIAIAQDLTLNGSGSANTILDGETLYRVININNAAATVTLNDLSITNGNVNFDGTLGPFENDSGNGGGILNSGTLIVNNATLSNNSASSFGGGVNNIGILSVTNSIISGNQAAFGGGIDNDGNGILSVTNSTVSGNEAVESGGGIDNGGILSVTNSIINGNEAFRSFGGGIRNFGTASLIGSVINGNEAALSGGGIDSDGVLSVTNSIINGNEAGVRGGGIDNFFGTASISGSTISGNRASTVGGGVFNSGILNVTNSTLVGNSATSEGGGIGNFADEFADELFFGGDGVSGTITLTNSILSDNFADIGGGIRNSGTASVTGSTFNGNSANFGGGISNDGILSVVSSILSGNEADFGGGIDNDNAGSLSVTTTTLSNNLAGSSGGGIFSSGNLTVTDSFLTGNNAALDGGGILTFGGTLELTASTLSENQAGAAGGGIYNELLSIATVSNATFYANRADRGGGIRNEGTFSLTNVTLSGNAAISSGGGIENSAFSLDGLLVDDGTLTLTNSLVSGNTAPVGANVFNASGADFVSGGTNLFGHSGLAGVAGAVLAAGDVVPLVPLDQILDTTLQENGGSTPTLALVPGSPAIDAGSGAGPDQRGLGVVRTRDIGAFEFQGPNVASVPCVVACGPDPASAAASAEQADNQQTTTDVADPEQSFTSEYTDFLGVEARAFADYNVLRRAQEVTGVAPALVYASFAPAVTPIAPAAGSTRDDVLHLLLVMPSGDRQRVITDIPRREVLQAVRAFRREILAPSSRRFGTTDYLEPAQTLYQWLVAPLQAELDRNAIGHISFILDEGLRSLPVAALHDGEQFLIENYSVGLMPSLSLTDTRITPLGNAAVLAMGASEFTEQAPLPGVVLELDVIDALWPGSVFLNEPFTPDTLLRVRRQSPHVLIHLATHAEFVDGPLSESYIQFWDRQFSLAELPTLNLDSPTVELFVLSACQTASGSERAELGFAGLAIKSGAKSAIATLWPVSDLETAGFMAELYTHLSQVTYKAEALRQAQLAMLRGAVAVQDGELVWSGGRASLPSNVRGLRFADTQHPYYWSAFTLVGNPW